ncbi:hypothetical protein C8R47DRAFT_1219818 [Mycena vitilis]|nr:hypothetical protein C8R47DRAFT_1219818 [Mycena vitilis]
MPASLSEIDNEVSESEEDHDLGEHSDGGQEGDAAPGLQGAASVVGSCEYCNSVADSRIFHCDECDGRQCESCCHIVHVAKPKHILKEWVGNEWKEMTFEDSKLRAKYATLCGVCNRVLAEAAGRLNFSALLCDLCGVGVMCQSCCFKKHAKEPLHRVKFWTGGHWKKTTLRARGFVLQLGHGGDKCRAPDSEVSSLVVIGHDGVQ